MNFAPFKKRIAVLDSAQKSGPDGINNGQYFHTFCTYEIPDSWQKSNFQLYLFVYIYTPSEPAFHADSNPFGDPNKTERVITVFLFK